MSPMLRALQLRQRRRLARALVQAWATYAQQPTVANKINALELEQALADAKALYIPKQI
jgi:hypothetical protein